jgi:hypothetical protein
MNPVRPIAALVLLAALNRAAVGQMADSATRQQPSLPVRFSGDVSAFNELYGAQGTQPRRPGETWRLMLTPQLSVANTFSMGMSMLLSSEGSELRQSVSQLGLNPHWRSATLHLGDFSQNISGYTVQGTRLRGAGFDLRPGILRVSLQRGEAQRTVQAGGAGNLAYRRTLTAAMLGAGREQSSYLDLIALSARDDASSLTQALADTLLLDTIPPALRPRYDTRPQQNLVLGARGQTTILGRRLQVSGEGVVGVITRDLDAPVADPSSLAGGNTLGALVPVTLSTSRDYALRVDGSYTAGPGAVRAGYEYVGPGFTSLGLAYVISDKQAWSLGGNLQLGGGRLNLQGQVQHQNDNLAAQRATTTDRDALMGSASVLFSRNVTASFTAMTNTIANDATVDTAVVDNRALALTANGAVQTAIAGMRSTLTLAWAFQRTSDANVITRIPQVTVQNVSSAVQLVVSRALSLAPSVSYAVTVTEGAPSQGNVFLGMRAQGRFGTLRPSLAYTRNYTGSRAVTVLTGQVGWSLPTGARIQLQGRHARYDAVGSRPAFRESFLTLSVTRSF